MPFLDWAKQDYAPGLWLDRKDNNAGYFPDNCQWITPEASRDNVRGTMIITAFGETKTVAAWSRDSRCVVKRDTLRARIKYGFPQEKAITTPVGVLKGVINRQKNRLLSSKQPSIQPTT